MNVPYRGLWQEVSELGSSGLNWRKLSRLRFTFFSQNGCVLNFKRIYLRKRNWVKSWLKGKMRVAVWCTFMNEILRNMAIHKNPYPAKSSLWPQFASRTFCSTPVSPSESIEGSSCSLGSTNSLFHLLPLLFSASLFCSSWPPVASPASRPRPRGQAGGRSWPRSHLWP